MHHTLTRDGHPRRVSLFGLEKHKPNNSSKTTNTMKKTYITPALVTAALRMQSLCKDSMKLDDSNPVGGGSALTRQMWADEEEQQ